MDITKISYINGYLNWDAISTISNIILVAALLFITWLYARQVRKQTKFMELDRMRNRILEVVQYVLNPLIASLYSELETIKEGESFCYSTQTGFGQEFSKFFNYEKDYSYAFRDILTFRDVSFFHKLRGELLSNDELSNKLNELYLKIVEEITNEFRIDKFKERLKCMLNEFNQSNPDKIETDVRALNRFEELCRDYIICKCNSHDVYKAETELIANFMKKNKGELLKYRDLSRIDKLCKEIEEALKKFEESDRKLHERFHKRINKYRDEYRLNRKEISPFIRHD
ncbi:hypothetical protein C4E24_04505 [ANME-1 cluster archaeon AG-394-G21]|nr:hypothetical protein [ANME-1 cluster archaeon AG-394-G21]